MFLISTNKVCHEESAFRKYNELVKAFIIYYAGRMQRITCVIGYIEEWAGRGGCHASAMKLNCV